MPCKSTGIHSNQIDLEEAAHSYIAYITQRRVLAGFAPWVARVLPSLLPSVVNRDTPKQTQLNCSPSSALVANSLNLKMKGKLFPIC